MEDESLGEWMARQISILRGRGLSGEEMKTELLRLFWAKNREYLSSLLADARNMEEAWRVSADCVEQELHALMMAMSDVIAAAASPENHTSTCGNS